jgi:acetyl esterase/lipase
MRASLYFMLVFVVTSAVLALGQPTTPAPLPPGTKVLRDLPYVENGRERQKLDLYLPPTGSGWPLVVMIHGGAFRMGSKDGEPAAVFVQRGYAVAAINYRLSQHAIFPAQIEDCKAAVRWLRAHAAAYGYDPARIAAFGQSAGGHLAAMLGTTGDVKAFDAGAHLDVSSRVQAVADFFGPTDFLQMDAHRVSAQADVHEAPDSPESQLVGGPIRDNPEQVARANPVTYVTPDDPPFLIVHGDADMLVPHHQSELLAAALRKAGVRSKFVTVPGGPHAGRTTAEGLPIALDFLDARFAPASAAADWLHAARFGVFMHVLPLDAKGLEAVRAFDVEALAAQLAAAHARYFVLTLGQNSGYFNAPNAAYDRIAGYRAGERCSTRDLPLALSDALRAKGIRLMLYLPSQPPNEDPQAQRAFGLPEGQKDQPLTADAARKWAEVIREWSDRYGDRVSGWWFDGGYDHVRFDGQIAAIYAAAARHGHPASIVTFNPGVMLVRHTRAEDYTAGETNEPFDVLPASRFVDGAQWHALTYLGTHWGGRDTRYPTAQWASWVAAATSKDGVVTIDAGPDWDPAAGPIGAIAAPQLSQLAAMGAAARGR